MSLFYDSLIVLVGWSPSFKLHRCSTILFLLVMMPQNIVKLMVCFDIRKDTFRLYLYTAMNQAFRENIVGKQYRKKVIYFLILCICHLDNWFKSILNAFI